MPLLGWNRYVPEGALTTCGVDWFSRRPADQAYIIFIFVLFFLVPVVALCFCYTKIFLTVRETRRRWRAQSLQAKKRAEREHQIAITGKNGKKNDGNDVVTWGLMNGAFTREKE